MLYINMKRLLGQMAFICVIITTSYPARADIKIASIFSITGKAAMNDLSSVKGVRYAVSDINDNGGVQGETLTLLEFDNMSSALGSKQAAEKAAEAGVVTVIGAVRSSHSLAAATVLQEAGIPMITPFSTNPKVTLTGDYIFRICYTDSYQGKILAKFALKDLNVQTAGVLVNVSSQYSEGLAAVFAENFELMGGKILFVESHLEKAVNFNALIEKAKQSKPEVMFIPGHTKDSAIVIKHMKESGIRTIFLGGDGWSNRMYSHVGEIIDGSYYATHWHQDSTFPPNIQFLARYRKNARIAAPGSALSEDCVRLFADAVTRAQSTDPARIRDALAATRNFEGVTGTLSFNENGDPIKPAVILIFEKGASAYVKSVLP